MDISEFITLLANRPMPEKRVSQIKLLARELAEGALEGLWSSNAIAVASTGSKNEIQFRQVHEYLAQRWQDDYPHPSLLASMGYLAVARTEEKQVSGAAPVTLTTTYYSLTEKTFALLEEAAPASVFISYSRRCSSAFALLLRARLKSIGVSAFVDLEIDPGEDWRERLKNEVESADYFLLILGRDVPPVVAVGDGTYALPADYKKRDTLDSPYVLEEIRWAMQSPKSPSIVPIAHGGFTYDPEYWRPIVGDDIDELLNNHHRISVDTESALHYETAIMQLLSGVFGM